MYSSKYMVLSAHLRKTYGYALHSSTQEFLLYSQGVTTYRKIYNFSFFVGTSNTYAQNHKYSSGVSTSGLFTEL